MVTQLFTMLWGEAGQAMVPAYADPTSMYVPANEIWIVEACGVFIDRNIPPSDFKLQYQVKDIVGGTNGWLVPLHVNIGKMDTTPVLALDRRVVLLPHTRISARVAWGETETKMGIMLTGFKVPYTQENLDRVILGSTIVAGGSTPPIDLSGFVAQCQAAAVTLGAIQNPA